MPGGRRGPGDGNGSGFLRRKAGKRETDDLIVFIPDLSTDTHRQMSYELLSDKKIIKGSKHGQCWTVHVITWRVSWLLRRVFGSTSYIEPFRPWLQSICIKQSPINSVGSTHHPYTYPYTDYGHQLACALFSLHSTNSTSIISQALANIRQQIILD